MRLLEEVTTTVVVIYSIAHVRIILLLGLIDWVCIDRLYAYMVLSGDVHKGIPHVFRLFD